MRHVGVLVILVSLAGALALAQSGPSSYLILGTGQGHGSTAFADRVGAAGGYVTDNIEEIGVVTAISENPSFAALMQKERGVKAVSLDPQISWVPEERTVIAGDIRTQAVPAGGQETFSAIQWNLRQIHADKTAANGDRGWGVVRARVAVVDSGIVTDHPDIAPNLNLTLSKSFVPNEPDLNPPFDTFNHGTHVAAIIAAPVNGVGIQGVAPDAELVAVKVLSAADTTGTTGWILRGIVYASGPTVHADVINLSLGGIRDRLYRGGGDAGTVISAYNRAVDHATAAGSLVVSAAMNNAANLNGRLFVNPAQSGNGMAVAATAPCGWGKLGDSGVNFDLAASYTNYGQSVIDVAAPGGDFAYPYNDVCTYSVYPSGTDSMPCWALDGVISASKRFIGDWYGYSWDAGTSMATPHVSGIAALIIGKYGRIGPARVKLLIENSAVDILRPGADPYSGKGRVDALRALSR